MRHATLEMVDIHLLHTLVAALCAPSGAIHRDSSSFASEVRFLVVARFLAMARLGDGEVEVYHNGGGSHNGHFLSRVVFWQGIDMLRCRILSVAPI